MTASIFRRARTEPSGPWQPPQMTMPAALTSIPRGWRRLGDIRGQPWYATKEWGAAEAEVTTTEYRVNQAQFPNAVLLLRHDEADEEIATLVKLHAPGTYDRLAAAKPRPAPERQRAEFMPVGASVVPLVKGQPIDGLAAFYRFGGGAYVGRTNIRGAKAVLHFIATKGDPTRYLVDAHPLVAPYVASGKEPDCAFGCGRTATTTALASPVAVAWCGEWPCDKKGGR